MWKKIAIAGGVCAAVAGIGTAALATSGSSTVSGAPASSANATKGPAAGGGKDRAAKSLKHAVHAQWVTKGKDNKFVTHESIRGTVTAVSATSITVLAEDKKSETFAVNADTKVRVRASGKAAKGTIGQVHSGDKALVVGTGTTTSTANGIIDGGK